MPNFDKMSDDELREHLGQVLDTWSIPLANPYATDTSYAAFLATLPQGLRAMAATHHLDISLTLDDMGWHFLNFGEPNFVRETSTVCANWSYTTWRFGSTKPIS